MSVNMGTAARRTGRWALALLACALLLFAQQPPAFRRISLSELRDKIEGGWAGQMIGVSYTAPTEFWHRGKTIEGPLPPWKPENVAEALDQDDLYVDMTLARVLDEKGLNATTEDFGELFRNAKYGLWHANLAARRALRRGVPAALSGTPRYNAHANDIDFQMESDFIGMMAPGLPQAAAGFCSRVGRVMNYGDGIYGGMFVACMYSAAYFETDPRKVVEAGLACLPPESPYAKLINDVLAWSKQYPNDWKKVWSLVEQKWNRRKPCPQGALAEFNIDAKLNGAYVALGLLFGGGDFDRTLDIATRSGQDSDCNASTACGILGVMHGRRRIPDCWKSGIPAIADRKFSCTDFSFRAIVESTEQRAVALAQANGGRVEGDSLFVKTQPPPATKLEVWEDYGNPVERIKPSDRRWTWKGEWRTEWDDRRKKYGYQAEIRLAAKRGAELTIPFEGSGAILTGPYLPTGGRADVYLDGKLDRTVDVYPDEDAAKRTEVVWHAFGLKKGRHVLCLVVRGEPFGDSKGTEIGVEDLIVFR